MSYLDYREYVYYYKTVVVVMVASLFDIELSYNLGKILKLIVEFMGIKYFAFKNDWSSTKGLQRQLFFFIILQILLLLLNYVIPGGGYWNLLKKRLGSPVEGKVKYILSYLGYKNSITRYLTNKTTGKLDIGSITENILLLGYDFLKISIFSFPVYRNIIFTPNV